MLDAERALARREAAAGMIPAAAAEAIAAACRAELFERERIAREGRGSGNPAEPLVRALRAEVGGEAAGCVHYGATSQDIVDTAAVLVGRRALELILADVGGRHRGLRRARRCAPRDADGRAHAAAARAADDVRVQGRELARGRARGREARARPPATGWPPSSAARPARSRRSASTGRRSPRAIASELGLRRAGAAVAHLARARRGARLRARDRSPARSARSRSTSC